MPAAAGTASRERSRKRRVPGDESVYREVYDAILAHRLTPGTRLGEDALGEIFGVSRTVVRKALFRLKSVGVVEIRPNRGAIVARPSIEEVRDVFEARRVLERAVLERLAATITTAQIEDLRAVVDQEQEAYESGDRRRWIRLSGDFHLHLADFAGNAVLADFLRELVSRTSLAIALYERLGNAPCSFDDHRRLIDAVAARDRSLAASLMDRHLVGCEDKLKSTEQGATPNLSQVFGHIQSRRK